MLVGFITFSMQKILFPFDTLFNFLQKVGCLKVK